MPGYDDERRDSHGEIQFASPGGHSALRASSRRNRPCPTCGQPNRLTPADVARHYQGDECANRAEGAF